MRFLGRKPEDKRRRLDVSQTLKRRRVSTKNFDVCSKAFKKISLHLVILP